MLILDSLVTLPFIDTFSVQLTASLLAALFCLVFFGSVIIYHHFIYPVLIGALARRKRHLRLPAAPVLYPKEEHHESELGWPKVTLLIPVYNEGALVAEKIRNLALLDYPSDRLCIFFLFDGCTDNSVKVAQRTLEEDFCCHLNCQLHIDPVNRGKLAQLNRAIDRANTEIVALSDLSALLTVDSLKIAAQWFKQKQIGSVCATYRFLSDAQMQEQSYWQYQCAIKQAESHLGSTLGAHGAFYLIRKSLFKPLPEDTINDDFILPCEIIRQGYRVVYEPRIVAVELENSPLKQDFKRRLRISAGNMQQSLWFSDLICPSYGITGWMFFSCKWLRPFIPWCFIGCFLSSLWLSLISVWFTPFLILQCLVYCLVALQQVSPSQNNILIKLHYLISGHIIGFLGGIYYLRGDYKRPWKKVA